MLEGMEASVGLSELSEKQKSLYLAGEACRSEGNIVTTANLSSHPFTLSMFLSDHEIVGGAGLICELWQKKDW